MALRVLLQSVVVIALAACGGRTLEPPEGTDEPAKTPSSNEPSTPAPSASATSSTPPSSPSGSTTPSQPGDPFPICPSHAPLAGDACSTPNQGCAYVDYQAGTCVSFTCDTNGKWQSSTPAGC